MTTTYEKTGELRATAEQFRQGEVDIDGHVDARGIEYKGKAKRQPDGTWTAVAIVGSALCLVEIKLTLKEETMVSMRVDAVRVPPAVPDVKAAEDDGDDSCSRCNSSVCWEDGEVPDDVEHRICHHCAWEELEKLRTTIQQILSAVQGR